MPLVAVGRALLLVTSLWLAANPAWALDVPRTSPKDQRVRWVDYDPDNVIRVDTAPGIVTHIVLSDDERHLDHAFGDSDAYDLVENGKHVLIKPKADQANTNLIYITDKRSYTFLLEYAKKRTGREFFRLNLRYPEDEVARTAAADEKGLIQRELEKSDVAINWEHYTMSGDRSLAPAAAWDDGAQTWLRFAPGQDLPTIYFVDADGQEVMVNRHMADEQTIVLQRVAAKWHLRLGNQVLAVYNEAGVQARSLPTRTVSPVVERVLREEPDQ
nr:P-type conjugative transfer protein VirB9 [Achromobacter ruhlandii]